MSSLYDRKFIFEWIWIYIENKHTVNADECIAITIIRGAYYCRYWYAILMMQYLATHFDSCRSRRGVYDLVILNCWKTLKKRFPLKHCCKVDFGFRLWSGTTLHNWTHLICRHKLTTRAQTMSLVPRMRTGHFCYMPEWRRFRVPFIKSQLKR